jgi:hypothetical protein
VHCTATCDLERSFFVNQSATPTVTVCVHQSGTYVVLEQDDEFLQAAGDGAGPYALQHSVGDQLVEAPGGVDAATMRKVMLAYRRGDPAWRGAIAWAPVR